MDGSGSSGLRALLLQRRDALAAFLRARGGGDAAEDLVQELWLKLGRAPAGPIANPVAYLFRTAENLMRDRHRSDRQARLRDEEWTETGREAGGASGIPAGERVLIAREELAATQALLASFPPRTQDAFRLHRLDGLPQREIADRLGVSLSTIEKDLREIYRALVEMRLKTGESVMIREDGR